MKSFFLRILDALGWHIAKKSPYVNGQPLAFPPSRQKDVEQTVFIRVNNGAPFPVPPSRLKGAIYYLELVLEKGTYKILALVPGGMRVASEITTVRDLRNSLQQGHVINMIVY